ncbi:hypothetical protein FD51_GL000473 [Lacticaseibacillus zeae DSM 20178 = KCTC 3804]|uniref:Uncharacterized protein n=2 Tax=Lacticaseibacillus zeae TaxID=57037 RepID=A0A5R8M207_LACZE|nr:hypothetical protein [Lacticaseibacillus zeae]KRK13902.1 hypothetical protein FD51_GL000473 [Lacticaseibacillus zeae DSM 20178 = KCTC 3804]OLS04290.1 hypothetical protein AUQ39_13720 [Lacticaseibacillus casei]QVI33130.1 hypothetical protein KG087_05995 [Lacticaseibacillus zeae]TLF43721.1 hypothetical protein FEI14_02340 [Lacticaseibacillus zeae]
MTTKEDQLVEENNHLRTQLTAANKHYYEDLLVYMRTGAVLKDSTAIEQELLTILTDILAAQKDGVTALEYFGKQPKETTDDILAEVPISWFKSFKMVGYVLITYFLVTTIPALMMPTQPWDIGEELLVGIYFTFVALGIVTYIGHTTYKRNQQWGRWRIFLLWLACCALIAPGFLLPLFLKTPWQLDLSGVSGVVLIVILLIALGFAFWRQADKTMWLPFVPIIGIMAVLGIATRVPAWQPFLLKSTVGRIVLASVLILGIIVFNVLIWLTVRKMKRDE